MSESSVSSQSIGSQGDDRDAPDEPAGSTPAPHGDQDHSHRLNRQVEGAKERYHGSSAEHVWKRLDAMDFINRGMLFAAVLLLCFFPFLIIVNALAGRSASTGFVRRLGLNQQAARDVSHLFTSSHNTSAALSGASYVLFILGGIAAASALQELYERAFSLESRGMRDMLRRLAWLGVLIGGAVFAGWVGPKLDHTAGPVVLGVVGLLLITAFWWFTMWFLLAGRVHWHDLVPPAVATGLFWVGMVLVFRATFSSSVISNENKYGPIGVVFSLMSFLIAIGVVIILGAIVGAVWHERGLSFAAAVRRLRRKPIEMPAHPDRPSAPVGSGDDAASS